MANAGDTFYLLFKISRDSRTRPFPFYALRLAHSKKSCCASLFPTQPLGAWAKECDRRDLGMYAILATGVTSRHCRRLGQIMARATQACEAPFVEAFCYGTRDDEWVVAQCGPIKVHLFTRETREQYKLELLYRNPDEFFQPGYRAAFWKRFQISACRQENH